MTNGNDSATGFEFTNIDNRGVATLSKETGLTKREYFAAMAMQGLISCIVFDWKKYGDNPADATAKAAVEYSDALIKSLNQ